jgi:DNA-binding NarL/FixJ family response regulator
VSTIKVVLADDHAVVRAGIRAMLYGVAEVQIVGEAANGREALMLVEEHQPHVLLADISMPEMNGLETTIRVAKDFPEVRVIMLSMHAAEEYVWQALRAGAVGYLLKDSDVLELETAIQTVVAGKTYLTPAVSKHVVENYIQRLGSKASIADVLTPRQREILQLVAEGMMTKEIARRLGLSAKTVETHRSRLMERLDIHDVPGLVRYAMRMGWIPPEVGSGTRSKNPA